MDLPKAFRSSRWHTCPPGPPGLSLAFADEHCIQDKEKIFESFQTQLPLRPRFTVLYTAIPA